MSIDIFQERMAAYIDGQLGGQELVEFEQALKENPKWAKELAFHQLIVKAHQQRERLAIAAFLRQLHRESGDVEPEYQDKLPDNLAKDKARWLNWLTQLWLPVLLVVVFMTVGGYFWQEKKTSDKVIGIAEQLITHFEPDSLPVTLAKGSDKASAEYKGWTHYNNKEYANAIPYFQKGGTDATTYYALGLCFLYQKNYTEAVKNLEKVTEADISPYKADASYYVAIALLAQGRKTEAIEWLKKVSDTELKLKAENILQQLE